HLDGPARDRLQRPLRHRAGVGGFDATEAGAGRRRRPAPLASHHPRTLPSGVRSPGIFWGVKIFPRGSLFTPPPVPICPGHLIDFSPYAPIFCSLVLPI